MIPPRPFILKSPAPAGSHCEICFGTQNVYCGHIWLSWRMNDNSSGNKRMCFLCHECQEPDGGIMSIYSINGCVVYLTSSRSRWPRRLIIASIDVH